jgi:ribulose-phosphate 3-epimerase
MSNRKVEVSASIMCIDWLHAGDQLRVLEREGIDHLHWDVIDGRFAPDFTMGTSIINSFRSQTTLPSDYHLMVEEPNDLFNGFEVSPGDIFTIHQECCRNLHRDLVTLRRKGAKVGVALCPATPLDTLDYVIEDVDVILIMSVNPGFMGQKFVPQTLKKIERLRQLISDMHLDIRISVDGNVSYENAPDMVAAGADILVGGSSSLFRSDIPLEDSIKRLKDCIKEGLDRS